MAGNKSSNFFAGIIDGTGPTDDKKYDFVMAGGFCRQLSDGAFKGRSVYARGPQADGTGTDQAITRVTAEMVTASKAGKDIVLVGYSRGALACVIVAERLKDQKIPVHSMVLLDAVDRYFGAAPYKLVPQNVLASFRAFRKLSHSIVLKYEGTIPTVPMGNSAGLKAGLIAAGNVLAPSNPFRPSFSSTAQGVDFGPGITASDHPRYDYVGSHGAMGGVGYTWVSEDAICQANLIRDLTAWLRTRVEANVGLVANYDPDLTSAYMKVGSMKQLLTAAAASTFDRRLMQLERLDHFIFRLREAVGL